MKRKIQLIEKVSSTGPYFKVTDGENTEYISYSETGTGRTRDEAIKIANQIFNFWLRNGSQEIVLREMELMEL